LQFLTQDIGSVIKNTCLKKHWICCVMLRLLLFKSLMWLAGILFWGEIQMIGNSCEILFVQQKKQKNNKKKFKFKNKDKFTFLMELLSSLPDFDCYVCLLSHSLLIYLMYLKLLKFHSVKEMLETLVITQHALILK
jgi:hypothetical protein